MADGSSTSGTVTGGQNTLDVLLHVHPNDDGDACANASSDGSQPMRYRKTAGGDSVEVHCDPHELVEKFVASYYHRPHRVPAQEPVHVPGAFELLGRCNHTHQVRYALARNGGPSDRWRAAINVHVVEAGQSRTRPLAEELPAAYNESANLLYLYYTPPQHVNMRGGVDGFVGVVGWSLTRWGTEPVVPAYAPSWVRKATRHLRIEPLTRRAVGLWINNCGPRRAALADLLLGRSVCHLPRASHASPTHLACVLHTSLAYLPSVSHTSLARISPMRDLRRRTCYARQRLACRVVRAVPP